jgi:penicillin-binding protein 2
MGAGRVLGPRRQEAAPGASKLIVMNRTAQLAREIAAVLLVAVCAFPAPAATSAAAKSTPRATRTHRSHSSRTRGLPTFADPTTDDVPSYDDPVIRQAAVEALGSYNGTVVAVDPNTGRILAIVNQKLAFSDGTIPCSTIKPAIAVAALKENVITSDTMLKVSRRKYMNLTEAMAHSNNEFFEQLGRRMGFDTVSRYAHMLGLGELAGYDLPEEQIGTFPMAPPERGGVARMSSYGEGIKMTPLQLASMASAVANGGTLYYLQYPRTDKERRDFTPRIKRQLDIASLLPPIREGMLAAVLYGTGRASYDSGGDEMSLGKTGTCSDDKSHLGWFVSYADEARPKITLVILIRGRSRHVKGPTAAVVAGRIYRRLRSQNYFANLPRRADWPGGPAGN